MRGVNKGKRVHLERPITKGLFPGSYYKVKCLKCSKCSKCLKKMVNKTPPFHALKFVGVGHFEFGEDLNFQALHLSGVFFTHLMVITQGVQRTMHKQMSVMVF